MAAAPSAFCITTGSKTYDAVVVGSGPNGLAAAIRLAQEGLSVVVLEANQDLGGGSRSGQLTLPGFIHDLCSAVHPLAAGSPFFRELNLDKFGLAWIAPELPLAHPLDSGRAAVLDRSVARTAVGLGQDESAYRRLMQPLTQAWEVLVEEFLQPMLHWPDSPMKLAKFGLRSLCSAEGLAQHRFRDEPTKALFAGLAGHSFLPLDEIPSAAFGLVLAIMGHAVGWPFPRGGSQQIINALVAVLGELGAEIRTNCRVERLNQVPEARVVLFDVTPRQLLLIAGDQLSASYRKRLGPRRRRRSPPRPDPRRADGRAARP